MYERVFAEENEVSFFGAVIARELAYEGIGVIVELN